MQPQTYTMNPFTPTVAKMYAFSDPDVLFVRMKENIQSDAALNQDPF